METKEMKIVPPEGYEIDDKKSTFERIVFKKKCDDRPRSWEEFCKRGFTGEEGYISATVGANKTSCCKGDLKRPNDVGYVDSVKEAEAFVALMQLRQLRKAWVGYWEPNWLSTEPKYVFNGYKGYICIDSHYNYSKCLSFPTEDMAYEFMECFQDLLEKAKSLL